MEDLPKPVRDMTPEERAVEQARMDELIASGLIKFAGPFNTRDWRVVCPHPKDELSTEANPESEFR